MINEPSNIIAITHHNLCYRWLSGLEERLMNFVFVEPEQPQRIADLVNSIRINALIIHLPAAVDETSAEETSQHHLKESLELIESLSNKFPHIPVVVASEEVTQALLLPAMRAGARDFIQIGASSNEAYAQLARYSHGPKAEQKASPEYKGRIFTLINARVSDGNALLASHLALATQKQGSTILVDLGKPNADSLYVLGVSPKFSFYDALANSRRLDNTLIQTGFARHKSGLAILSLPDEGKTLDFTSAELYLVIDTLRKHFQYLVFNLGGNESIELTKLILPLASKTLIVVEQSIPSCKKNYELIEHLRSAKHLHQDCGLVIDRHLPKHKPSANDIAQSFDLPMYMALPSCGMARLSAYNLGESLSEVAPHNPYSTTVEQLATLLVTGKRPLKAGWAERFKALFRKNRKVTDANPAKVLTR